MGSTGKDDVSDSTQSIVSRRKAEVEKGGGIVTSIDDFYRKQRADKVGLNKKKGEAVKILHEFRGKSTGNTKKESIRNPILLQQAHEFTPEYYVAEKRKAEKMNLHQYSGLSFNMTKLQKNSHEASSLNKHDSPPLATTTKAGRLKEELSKVLSSNSSTPPNCKEDSASVLTESKSKDDLDVKDLAIETGRIDISEIKAVRLDAEQIEASSKGKDHRIHVDFQKYSYRSFIFVVHEQHGLMMLHCTPKESKNIDYQLPGGCIDQTEFQAAAENSEDIQSQLVAAAQATATRQLYKETGIDIRDKPYRLEPAAIRNEVVSDGNGELVMTCELEKTLYYFLPVNDEDFLQVSELDNDNDANAVAPASKDGCNLRLKLSTEHSGFQLEKDPEKAAELLKKYGAENESKALLMAIHRERDNGASLKEEECGTDTASLNQEEEQPIPEEKEENIAECDTSTSSPNQELESLPNGSLVEEQTIQNKEEVIACNNPNLQKGTVIEEQQIKNEEKEVVECDSAASFSNQDRESLQKNSVAEEHSIQNEDTVIECDNCTPSLNQEHEDVHKPIAVKEESIQNEEESIIECVAPTSLLKQRVQSLQEDVDAKNLIIKDEEESPSDCPLDSLSKQEPESVQKKKKGDEESIQRDNLSSDVGDTNHSHDESTSQHMAFGEYKDLDALLDDALQIDDSTKNKDNKLQASNHNIDSAGKSKRISTTRSSARTPNSAVKRSGKGNITRTQVARTPSPVGVKKNKTPSAKTPKSTTSSRNYFSPSPAPINRGRNAKAHIVCDKHWIVDLHGFRSGCERCLNLASPEVRQKFEAEGHHYRINRVRGGCTRSCKLFPRTEKDQPVRLCRKCFYDTHYFGKRQHTP